MRRSLVENSVEDGIKNKKMVNKIRIERALVCSCLFREKAR